LTNESAKENRMQGMNVQDFEIFEVVNKWHRQEADISLL